jgi:hypothetical protein
MSFKKIMLLASMAMAAVAFAAPAAQAMAPEWYHNGNTLQGEAPLHVTGELASTVIGGGGLISGPCEVTFEGVAENVNGMASGTITGGAIQEECETNVAGCTITPTLQAFPWTVTGVTITGTTGVDISGAQFENHYMGATCPVPVSTIMATGTATGLVDVNDHHCLDFNNHTDDMLTHAPLPTLTVDILGTVCDTTLTLT